MAITTVSTPVLVQIQTLRGNAGTQAAFAEVQKAVDAYNAVNAKSVKHVCELVTALADNTKGMQAKLAIMATVARKHGANMIRLSVHNGNVAICGTPSAVKAVQDTVIAVYSEYATMAANAYSQATHGNKVGFINGFTCGCPAGLQVTNGIAATLAYGVGFLFTFPAPGTGTGYVLGQNAVISAAKPMATKPVAAKSVKTAKAIAPKALEVLDAEVTALAVA